ncbi:MAG: hypothetical protein M3N32_07910 [Actinomycetota bacterium]|nr:hypothetical protein [Actinomycetota bacterium]
MSRPRLDPADRLASGQLVYVDVGGGLRLAHIISVNVRGEHVDMQLSVTVPSHNAVWVDSDPFEGLVEEGRT